MKMWISFRRVWSSIFFALLHLLDLLVGDLSLRLSISAHFVSLLSFHNFKWIENTKTGIDRAEQKNRGRKWSRCFGAKEKTIHSIWASLQMKRTHIKNQKCFLEFVRHICSGVNGNENIRANNWLEGANKRCNRVHVLRVAFLFHIGAVFNTTDWLSVCVWFETHIHHNNSQ